AAGSVLNVSRQRLSRSALENSQVPSAIALTSSLSGACACAPAITPIRPRRAMRLRIMNASFPDLLRSAALLRRPPRLRDRRQRALAGRPGRGIAEAELALFLARQIRGGAGMGNQYDVLHRHELRRHLRLVHVDVEPGGEDPLLLERADQRRLVDHRA